MDKKQDYSLQFHVLMQCNGYESECSYTSSFDYVSVKVSSQGRTVKESVLDYENIIEHNSWTLQSIELTEYGFDTIDVMSSNLCSFSITSIMIFYCFKISLKFARTEQTNFSMIIGFDNLELLLVDGTPTTIGPQIQTTTDSVSTLSTVSVTSETSPLSTVSETIVPTTSTSVLSTTTEAVYEIIYFCDFDSFLDEGKQCNGSLEVDGSVEIMPIKSVYIPSKPVGHYITDYSSISLPTSSNSTCVIPFFLNGFKYNFCVKQKNNFECLVSPTVATQPKFDYCSPGFFLHSRALRSNVFQSSFQTSILLHRIGLYEIRFFLVLHTLTTPDEQNSDYVELGANFDGTNLTQVLVSIDLKSSGNQDKWIESVVTFELKSEHTQKTQVID